MASRPSIHIDERAADPAGPPKGERTAPDRVVSTRELLGGAHRIWIEHAAERYLLRVTRSGKLILTK
jgi:hemin uptake protein HemP